MLSNEWLFLLQIIFTVSISLIALRLGRVTLTSWVALQGVLANLFVVKQINLFGLSVTCGDCYIVSSIFGLNLLQEFFGKEASRAAIPATFLGMLFMVVMSQFHLAYSPNDFDTTNGAFQTILQPAPRLLIASLITSLMVWVFDIRLFSWIKENFFILPYALRTAICMVISQLLDTILFTFLGLYGVINSPGHVIMVSFAIKMVCIAGLTPFGGVAKWARGEHVKV